MLGNDLDAKPAYARFRSCGGDGLLGFDLGAMGRGLDNGGEMISSLRAFSELPRLWQRWLARVDLREHEDKILLLLSLVISALVGLIVVAFVVLTAAVQVLSPGQREWDSPDAGGSHSAKGRHQLANGDREAHLLFHLIG
jgi:hypothetical protein